MFPLRSSHGNSLQWRVIMVEVILPKMIGPGVPLGAINRHMVKVYLLRIVSHQKSKYKQKLSSLLILQC